MVAGKRYNGLQTDIWSCGIILYAMVCGYLPFEDANTSTLYKKIMHGEYKTPSFLSERTKSLLRGILNKDPQQRFTIQQIREHEFVV
jgi:5'-AMP-activated protein kinase catalytic alpha subunit